MEDFIAYCCAAYVVAAFCGVATQLVLTLVQARR